MCQAAGGGGGERAGRLRVDRLLQKKIKKIPAIGRTRGGVKSGEGKVRSTR